MDTPIISPIVTKYPYLTNSEYLIDAILFVSIPKEEKTSIPQEKYAEKLQICSKILYNPSLNLDNIINNSDDFLDKLRTPLLRSIQTNYKPMSYFQFQQKEASYQSGSSRYMIFSYIYFDQSDSLKQSTINNNIPRIICIISQFPCPAFFRQLCLSITNQDQMNCDVPLEIILTTLVRYLPAPNTNSQTKVIIGYKINDSPKNKHKHTIESILNSTSIFPTFDFTIVGIFGCLDPTKFAKIYMLLFTSINICFFSEKDEILNITGNILLSLMYPIILDSALAEYSLEDFFERFGEVNSMEFDKRIYLIHGSYNKAKNKEMLKEIFEFVVVYDLDNDDLFSLISDIKKENNDDRKIQKKIFEQIGANRNKQLLIAPFFNRLDEISKKLCDKVFINNTNYNSTEDYIWSYSNISCNNNKNLQDACFYINMWFLSLLYYHDRRREQEARKKDNDKHKDKEDLKLLNTLYLFALKEKELYKGEKDYFLSFVNYYHGFLHDIKNYFVSLENDKYIIYLQRNTTERFTFMLIEELAVLYRTYFTIQKQNKSNFSFKEKGLEELDLSLLKDLFEDKEKNKDKENGKDKDKDKDKDTPNNNNKKKKKNSIHQPQKTKDKETYTIDIYSIAEAFYLEHQSEIDELIKRKKYFLDQNIINKCHEIIKNEPPDTANRIRENEQFSKENYYEQISIKHIPEILEKKILSEYRFTTGTNDFLHLSVLILLSMFIKDVDKYNEILINITKYHKLFLRKYLILILEQYTKGKQKNPDNENILKGIALISEYIYNEDIPMNEEMKLYIKPNTKFEKDKEKEKQIIKETKQKDEPIHKLVEGIHKLQLRENYCRDGTYDETYVASLYDSLYAYNKIEEMCISCPYCGFEVRPKVYLKFESLNKEDKQYEKLYALIEPIQVIFKKCQKMIGDTNIGKKTIIDVMLNLLFYYWKRIGNKVILQFIFDLIVDVYSDVELPYGYQL